MLSLRSIVLSFFCLLVLACSNSVKPPISSRPEAEKRFIQICQDDLHYNVVTRSLKNTFWVYLPIDHNMFDFKAKPKIPGFSTETPKPFALQYIDGEFTEKTFSIEYDIIPNMKSGKDHGYTTKYADDYTKKQNNILTAIFRTFSELEEKAIDVQSDNDILGPPDFFVIVIADVQRGIEIKNIFHTTDFKRYMTQSLPYEEYLKRYITQMNGDLSIIGDYQGRHLDYEEIQWPEFLTEQILARIRFKYQRSDFPPSDNHVQEILRIIAQTKQAYDFTDFDSIKFYDLRNGEKYLFGKSQLETFTEQN